MQFYIQKYGLGVGGEARSGGGRKPHAY